MKILYIFPKRENANGKSLKDCSSYINKIDEFIQPLIELGVSPVVRLEDTYGYERLFKDCDGAIDIITTIAESDYKYNLMKKNPLGYGSLILNSYSKAIPMMGNAEALYKVPNIATYQDKSKYVEDRLALINKRTTYAIKHLIKTYKNIIYFDMPKMNDLQKPVPAIGDGRLIIIVNLHTGSVDCSYGGVTVDMEIVKQILQAEVSHG